MATRPARRAALRRATAALIGASGVLGFQRLRAQPAQPAPGTSANPAIAFIDIPKFDTDLHNALSQRAEPVNVTFYERVSPNKMPERLQKWIATVEKSGGTVDVEPPADEPVPKGPLVLIGLLGALWSTLKALSEMKEEAVFLAASKRNVVIALERDANRQIVVSRITFAPRTGAGATPR